MRDDDLHKQSLCNSVVDPNSVSSYQLGCTALVVHARSSCIKVTAVGTLVLTTLTRFLQAFLIKEGGNAANCKSEAGSACTFCFAYKIRSISVQLLFTRCSAAAVLFGGRLCVSFQLRFVLPYTYAVSDVTKRNP